MAAQQVGIERVPVCWVDVDDATARRIMLADNRLGDLARYDEQKLVDLLTTANDDGLEGTGWDESDLSDLLMALTPKIDLDELADEWEREANAAATDSNKTVVLNLSAPVADRLQAYVDAIGDHDAAIRPLLDHLPEP